MVATALTEARVWELLDEVLDPEVPVLSILDLGIVRGVQVAGEQVTVHITPTYSGCPAMNTIAQPGLDHRLDDPGRSRKAGSLRHRAARRWHGHGPHAQSFWAGYRRALPQL
jgi:hypothetical protein